MKPPKNASHAKFPKVEVEIVEEEKNQQIQEEGIDESEEPVLEQPDLEAPEDGETITEVEPLTPEEIEQLQADLESAQAKVDENLDGWQRALADFANYKKRVERERAGVYQNAFGQAVRRYLEILDDLELALKDRPSDGDGAIWAEGIELIYRKLVTFLESEGIEPIEVLETPFDPNFHEAISLEPSEEHASGQIIEVVQNGYKIGDRVLRPAKVRVAE